MWWVLQHWQRTIRIWNIHKIWLLATSWPSFGASSPKKCWQNFLTKITSSRISHSSLIKILTKRRRIRPLWNRTPRSPWDLSMYQIDSLSKKIWIRHSSLKECRLSMSTLLKSRKMDYQKSNGLKIMVISNPKPALSKIRMHSSLKTSRGETFTWPCSVSTQPFLSTTVLQALPKSITMCLFMRDLAPSTSIHLPRSWLLRCWWLTKILQPGSIRRIRYPSATTFWPVALESLTIWIFLLSTLSLTRPSGRLSEAIWHWVPVSIYTNVAVKLNSNIMITKWETLIAAIWSLRMVTNFSSPTWCSRSTKSLYYSIEALRSQRAKRKARLWC